MKIAIIDPVGSKAGIDHYDLSLLSGLKNAGDNCFLYSNFDYEEGIISYKKNFHNVGVSKLSAIISNFVGFFKSLSDAKKQKVDWLILHVFRAGAFDLFTFTLAKFMGFKLLAIVHDIESLDTITLPIVRRTVISFLPDLRVVHNQFCKDEIAKQISDKALDTTGIIPHVNFIKLFNRYHSNANLKSDLLNDKNAISSLDPKLLNDVIANEKIILFFGQIKKSKGVDVLLEAIPFCKTNFKVVVAGKLRGENWEKYQSIIDSKNLNDKVIPIIRHISDYERDILFSLAHGIVLPYRYIYQSGVLLMTMSFPMAVIASNLPPNVDTIIDSKNGFLFEAENSNDLANKIDALINISELEQIKIRALGDIETKNSPNVIGKQYHDFISKAISK
ncbi:MAG TPA: glycosyltransferase family 4 protein [Bacteroidia bacterium]|jgi:glycosyltransferase involved in cell wall biosynthesis|nr:glycosyltransferase family 4 protein [Bacteroidia bacterium]HQF27002.1 glycosyltransferase family 4 protein [Bacteroidia bacterium]HQK96863.1 glycosyltransferase family 4 protein [Bacteroidia bacterium]